MMAGLTRYLKKETHILVLLLLRISIPLENEVEEIFCKALKYRKFQVHSKF
jgi:hypothetical protein